MEPTTGYALLDDQRIAFQVIGDGPVDIVFAPGWFSAFDIEWDHPELRAFFQRMAGFSRVIRLDRRGSGASDPLPSDDDLPAWETFADDIACVMDAVGVEDAFLWGDGDAGPLSVLYAATHPHRVRGLLLFHTAARFLAADDYEFGMPSDFSDEMAEFMIQDWGSASGEHLAMWVPSRADDPEFRRWVSRLMRATTTPSSVKRYMDGVITADVRDFLPSISVPTLVMHPPASQMLTYQHAEYLADHIPDSTLVPLAGDGDVFPGFGLADQVVSEVQRFITGAPPPIRTERALATVLFTDIVSSTELATQLGDRQWRKTLDRHDNLVNKNLAIHAGTLVKHTGDGILATFDGPGRAVGFATALIADLADMELSIRTGIHTGEIEKREADLGGVAVHLCARIMAVAEGGEILVSRTVRDLVIGSPLSFEDRGSHALKGIDGEWQLYAVANGGAANQDGDRSG